MNTNEHLLSTLDWPELRTHGRVVRTEQEDLGFHSSSFPGVFLSLVKDDLEKSENLPFKKIFNVSMLG